MKIFFRNNVWGLDIGSNSIKLCNVLVKRKKIIVKKYFILEDYVKGKKGSDYITGKYRDYLVDNLTIFFKKNKLDLDLVNFVLPSFGIFFKKFEVPRMKEKEIKNMIDYQVEGMFKRSKDNFVVDQSISFKKDKVVVSYVCVYKQIFDLYNLIAKRAGFKINKILLEQKCYTSFVKEEDFLVVDIGGEVTSFSVFLNKELEAVDNLYKGGETFTTLFASGNDISFDEAEKIKREKGLMVDSQGFYFYPQLNNVVEKINFLIKEYPVKKIYLTGGGSNIKGGVEYFKEKLNLPVSFFDFSVVQNSELSDDLLNRLWNSILVNFK